MSKSRQAPHATTKGTQVLVIHERSDQSRRYIAALRAKLPSTPIVSYNRYSSNIAELLYIAEQRIITFPTLLVVRDNTVMVRLQHLPTITQLRAVLKKINASSPESA